MTVSQMMRLLRCPLKNFKLMDLFSFGIFFKFFQKFIKFLFQKRAINAKYRFSCKLIEHWGYKLVDEVTWVKKTVNGKIAKGHGFYLQHAKESCLIGVKVKNT